MDSAPPPPDRAARVAKLLEGVDWRATSARLTLYAHLRTGRRSLARAKDFAQEAILQVYDPRYQDWDPDGEPELFEHLKNVVRGLVSNQRRTRSAQEIPASPGMLAARAGDDPRERASAAAAVKVRGELPETTAAKRRAPDAGAESPEAIVARREIARAMDEGIAKLFAGAPRVLEVVALSKKGVTTLSAQADAMGLTVFEVHGLRERLFRGLAKVERELHAK